MLDIRLNSVRKTVFAIGSFSILQMFQTLQKDMSIQEAESSKDEKNGQNIQSFFRDAFP